MTTKQLELIIESAIDRKFEDLFQNYFGDPDERLSLKEGFVKEIKKRTESQDKFIDNNAIMKKYDLA